MTEKSRQSRQRISPSDVKKLLETGEKNERLWDSHVNGLHLRVSSPGRVAWRLYFKSQTGRWRTFTIGKANDLSVANARDTARDYLLKIHNGENPIESRKAARESEDYDNAQTVLAYLEGPYATYLRRRKGGYNTDNLIRVHFKAWLHRPMSNLRPAQLHQWQSDRELNGKAWGTISRAWDAMRAMLNHARKRGFIDQNPLSGCALEKPAMTEDELSGAGSKRRFLSSDEIGALFQGIEAYQEARRKERRSSRAHGKPHLTDLDEVVFVDHVAPWLNTMFYTGFRPGDIFGLQWQHVDLEHKRIRKTIEKTAHQHPAPRVFPLSDPARDVLEQWWQQNGRPESGYVFPSPRTGSRFDKQAMQKPWKRIKEYGGLQKDLQLYTLRHHYASTLVMQGVDLLTVSSLMAHSDINTTIQNYGHLQPDLAREVVNAFAAQPYWRNGASVTD